MSEVTRDQLSEADDSSRVKAALLKALRDAPEPVLTLPVPTDAQLRYGDWWHGVRAEALRLVGGRK